MAPGKIGWWTIARKHGVFDVFFCLGDVLSREENWDFGSYFGCPLGPRSDATHWQLAILGVDEKGCPREAVCWAYMQARKGKNNVWQVGGKQGSHRFGLWSFLKNFIALKGQFFEWRKWQQKYKNTYSPQGICTILWYHTSTRKQRSKTS